jgi:hypothetical protein
MKEHMNWPMILSAGPGYFCLWGSSMYRGQRKGEGGGGYLGVRTEGEERERGTEAESESLKN